MKTKKELWKDIRKTNWSHEYAENGIVNFEDACKYADQEKQALKEKIYNHVVSKLAEYERDDDGDPWYNGAKTEMEELRKYLASI